MSCYDPNKGLSIEFEELQIRYDRMAVLLYSICSGLDNNWYGRAIRDGIPGLTDWYKQHEVADHRIVTRIRTDHSPEEFAKCTTRLRDAFFRPR